VSTFPLPILPAQNFQSGALSFGNNRGKVDHAACDLVATAGTKVLSMDDGVVWYGPSKFFESKPDLDGHTIWTYELAIIYDNYIVRYGEIGPRLPQDVYPGASVAQGQTIAWVGNQVGSTMLHLEMFGNPASKAPLTNRGNSNYWFVPPARYNRREDLLDPTGILLVLMWALQLNWNL
jgi:hypothetical protein